MVNWLDVRDKWGEFRLKVGQVWQEVDRRISARQFEILEIDVNNARVQVRSLSFGRKTWISLERLLENGPHEANSRGYKLFRDVRARGIRGTSVLRIDLRKRAFAFTVRGKAR